MTTRSLFISDGYTERGFIAGADWEPGLRFRYRPMLPEEVAEFLENIARYKAKAAEQLTAKTVGGRLISWDLVDADNNPVPVSHENLLRLHRRYYLRAVAIVMGHEAGDKEPDGQPNEVLNWDAYAKN
jgi:hypothetical protein